MPMAEEPARFDEQMTYCEVFRGSPNTGTLGIEDGSLVDVARCDKASICFSGATLFHVSSEAFRHLVST